MPYFYLFQVDIEFIYAIIVQREITKIVHIDP